MADDEQLIRRLLEPYSIDLSGFEKMDGYGSQNFKVSDQSGKKYTLKYYQDPNFLDVIQSEIRLIQKVAGSLPYLLQDPHPIHPYYVYDDGSFSRLLHFIEGKLVAHYQILNIFEWGRC